MKAHKHTSAELHRPTPDEIDLATEVFQMLADASLDPVSSRELILDTAESYWSGVRRPVHV